MQSINSSLYRFKIIENEWQDWDSLNFTLHFSKNVSKIEKSLIETSIDQWFVQNQDKNDGGFHYLDTFKWPDNKTLIFYIDFGSAEFDELNSFLNLLNQRSLLLLSVEIGRKPENTNKKYYYKATILPGVLENPYPFKVTQIAGGTDWGLTLYFKHACNPKIQKDIELQIQEWFKQPKDRQDFPGIDDSWMSDFEWQTNMIVGWWVGGRSGPAAMFNDLFRALSGFSDIIDELIIGPRFPDRQKIDYTI